MATTQPLTPKQIDALLARFMDGQTTVEEEQTLALFFRQRNIVRPEWEPYKQMFAYFDHGMEDDGVNNEASGKKRHPRWRWIAAVVAVLLAGGAITLWQCLPSANPEQAAIAQSPSLPQGETREDKPLAPLNPHGKPMTTIASAPRTTTDNVKNNKKRARKARRRNTPSPTDIISKEPFHIAKLVMPENDSIADESFRETYVLAIKQQDVMMKRAQYIEETLEENGFKPIRQEDGTIIYTKDIETTTTNDDLNII